MSLAIDNIEILITFINCNLYNSSFAMSFNNYFLFYIGEGGIIGQTYDSSSHSFNLGRLVLGNGIYLGIKFSI